MESEPVIWVSQVATLCPDTPSPVAQKPPSGVILIPPSVLKRSRNSDTVKTLRSSQKMIRGTTDVPRTKSQMPVAKVTIKAQTKFPTRLLARYRFNGEASFKDSLRAQRQTSQEETQARPAIAKHFGREIRADRIFITLGNIDPSQNCRG